MIYLFCSSLVYSQNQIIKTDNKPTGSAVSYSDAPVKLQYNDIYGTVNTPRGTVVYVTRNENFTVDHTPNSDWMIWNYTYSNFPLFWSKASNITLDSADRRYNCHGYAWHMYPNYSSDPVDMASIEARKYGDPPYGDGSFSRVENFSDCEKIVFTDSDHSAINVTGNIYSLYSKWYYSRLMQHPENDNPFTGAGADYYSRAHDVPYEHSSLVEAMNSAKQSQVFKVWDSRSLDGNLNFRGQLQKKFEVRPNVTLSLAGYYISGRIINNGTITPSNITITDPNYGFYGVFSTLDQALSAAQSGQTIVTEGNLSISSTVTIPSGVTLQLQSGVTIDCSGSIIVEGTLAASGNTFNFSGGGFSVGSPGSLTLSNCTINNATVGLSLNNRAPSISGCRFVNCGTAVSAANYSNAYLYPNLFSGSSYGINIDAVSSPICGGSSTFRYNTWDIYSSGSQPIYAQGNYWGPCPPVPSNYGNINISNYMCSDPWPNVKTPEIPGAVEDIFLSVKSISKSRTSVETDVESYKFAQLLFINGKYDEAIAESEYLIGKFTDSELAKSAIVLIEMCLQKNKADSLITKKLDEIGGKYRTNKLTEFVEYRKAYRSVDKGDFTEAVESFKKILKGSTDSTIIKNSLYQIGNLTYCYTEDKITGNEYFGRLLREYPYDHLSTIAGIKLGRGDIKIEDKSTASKDESSNISMQNYPNPFNPVTTIEYRLNKSGLVCMKVFDVLGREVKTLVNETKEKGVFKVIFDGKNHSSGNYFYRLEFTPSEGKKEILQKSMQIVK